MSALREAIPRTPELEGQLLSLIAGGHTIAGAAARCFISGPLVHKWKKADPAFAERLAAARLANGGKFVRAQPTDPRAEREKRDRARRGWCADRACGTCRSCRCRRASAASWAPHIRRTQRWSDWSDREDAVLRDLAGRRTTGEIAQAVNAAQLPGMRTRTVQAVHGRATLLGLSLDCYGNRLSASDLQALFGANHVTVRRLMATGEWPSYRTQDRTGSPYYMEAADVERFIRGKPWAYNPRTLGAGRLADLGRLIHRSDPWLTLAEVADWLGCHVKTVLRFTTLGVLPFRLRVVGLKGRATIVVRRRDLPAFAERLDARRANQRATALGNLAAHNALRRAS